MQSSYTLGSSPAPFRSAHLQRRCRSVVAHAQKSIQFKLTSQIQRSQLISLGLAGSFLAAPAWAEELVQEIQEKASELPSSLPSPDQVSAAVQKGSGGGFFDLFADNPILLGGLVLLAAVPFLFSFLQGGALGVKQVNAAGAVEGLTSDPATILLDIRNKTEIKEQGTPNLASTKKKAIVLPFTQLVEGEVEEIESFAESFGKLKQVKAESTIILLDSFGQDAPKAAKLLANIVDRVYYVTDGAVGPTGWKESGQPWKEPGQSFLSGLSLDSIAEDFKAQPTVAKAGIAAGALGLAGAVLFQEVGTAIELAAVAAAGAVLVPRFVSGSESSDVLPDAPSETTKKQVKEFVEESTKDPAKAVNKAEKKVERSAGKAAGKAKSIASDVQSEAKSVADNGDASSLTAKASKTQDKAEDKVEDAKENVQEVVQDASQIAQDSAVEAKEWIESWRKDQPKK